MGGQGAGVTVASYATCLVLIAAGHSSSQLGAIGFVGWLAAMGLALMNFVLGGRVSHGMVERLAALRRPRRQCSQPV
jgi:hypothetical protein